MSSEVALPGQQPDRQIERAPDNKLARWAFEARQANSIAQSLNGTTFVPASMKGNVGDITGAILAGAELGMQPIAALRSIDIIQGTPALRAVAMRGLVQNQGHEIELVESTATRCVMRGRRAGSDGWQTVDWPIERAQQMGLTGKNEWKRQPTAMLVARATSEICRLVAADVLLAMPYSAEELAHVAASERLVTTAEVTIDRPARDPHRVTLEELDSAPSAARQALNVLESQAAGERGPLNGAEMLDMAQRVAAEHGVELPHDFEQDEQEWPEPAPIGGAS